ncbi:MAG: cofactor assembly of complex C subunit B [Cyanobacteriota bacterium]|nr:cofactor assembly of complex C subunit B [Cyanobacteriota bacterium]
MGLPPPARIPLLAGVFGIAGVLLNQLIGAPEPTPALLRAEALAALMGVVLMLVAVLWSRAAPAAPERLPLDGEQGLRLRQNLDDGLATDLAWGSQMLLTATPAVCVLLVWDGEVLLQRGLMVEGPAFQPGPVCRQAQRRGRAIALVNLALYPGRGEFDALLPGLPSVVVEPLLERGWLLVGGWSARCFSRSDEAWIHGLGERFTARLLGGPVSAGGLVAES